MKIRSTSASAAIAPPALKVAGVLAVPALLLLLVAGSVAWAVNDPGLYRNGFTRYDTALRSGIADADLLAIGAELRRYFNSRAEPLAVRAPIYGVEQEVFNAREIAHMRDVKRLVRGVYWGCRRRGAVAGGDPGGRVHPSPGAVYWNGGAAGDWGRGADPGRRSCRGDGGGNQL